MNTFTSYERKKITNILAGAASPPTQAEIEAAPTINGWVAFKKEDTVVLFGFVKNHPEMKDNSRIATSPLIEAEFGSGFIRTMHRVYKLGEPDGGTLKGKIANPIYEEINLDEACYHTVCYKNKLQAATTAAA